MSKKIYKKTMTTGDGFIWVETDREFFEKNIEVKVYGYSHNAVATLTKQQALHLARLIDEAVDILEDDE